jgi:hypothetical protein
MRAQIVAYSMVINPKNILNGMYSIFELLINYRKPTWGILNFKMAVDAVGPEICTNLSWQYGCTAIYSKFKDGLLRQHFDNYFEL